MRKAKPASLALAGADDQPHKHYVGSKFYCKIITLLNGAVHFINWNVTLSGIMILA